jgi:hypothetical protein
MINFTREISRLILYLSVDKSLITGYTFLDTPGMTYEDGDHTKINRYLTGVQNESNSFFHYNIILRREKCGFY